VLQNIAEVGQGAVEFPAVDGLGGLARVLERDTEVGTASAGALCVVKAGCSVANLPQLMPCSRGGALDWGAEQCSRTYHFVVLAMSCGVSSGAEVVEVDEGQNRTTVGFGKTSGPGGVSLAPPFALTERWIFFELQLLPRGPARVDSTSARPFPIPPAHSHIQQWLSLPGTISCAQLVPLETGAMALGLLRMQQHQILHAASAAAQSKKTTLTIFAEADAAAVTVVVVVVSLPAVDVAAVAAALAAVAVALAATVVAVAVAVEVPPVVVELLAAVVVVVLVAERTLTPRSLQRSQMANFAAARLLSSPIATPVSLSLAARRIFSSPRT
jgi:hypothetical protein